MKTKSHTKRYQKASGTLTLIVLFMSVSSTPSTHASLNCSSRRLRRRNDCGIKRVDDESMSAVVK